MLCCNAQAYTILLLPLLRSLPGRTIILPSAAQPEALPHQARRLSPPVSLMLQVWVVTPAQRWAVTTRTSPSTGVAVNHCNFSCISMLLAVVQQHLLSCCVTDIQHMSAYRGTSLQRCVQRKLLCLHGHMRRASALYDAACKRICPLLLVLCLMLAIT
jgi:hypothetical protein